MNCIFCDIVNKKESAEILFENEKVISFLDIRPVNHGHSLVIPKKHYENFLLLPEDELQELIKVTQILSNAVKTGLNADGFNIIVNNGIAAGQTIFHFHFHIIPRYKNDFKFKPNFKNYDNDSMSNFSEKIKSFLKKNQSQGK